MSFLNQLNGDLNDLQTSQLTTNSVLRATVIPCLMLPHKNDYIYFLAVWYTYFKSGKKESSDIGLVLCFGRNLDLRYQNWYW